MKRINLDQMKNMSIDNLIELYRDGYRLEEHAPIRSLSNINRFSNIHPNIYSLQGPLLDPVVNFGKVTVSTGYDAIATSIVLNTNQGSKLPDPSVSGAFNLVWYNSTDYPDPSDDPNKEIVRCTARTTDTLTITRAQEGTSASAKNLAGKTYKMILTVTAKTMTDISSAITARVAKSGDTMTGNLEISKSNSAIRLTEPGGYDFLITNNAGSLNITSDDPANKAMTILSDGRLGIGTTSPQNSLHVVGTTLLQGDQNAIRYTDAAGNNRFLTGLRNDILGNTSDYVFYSYGGNWIYSGGNIGIGTTSPTQKLDVVGNINLNGGYLLNAWIQRYSGLTLITDDTAGNIRGLRIIGDAGISTTTTEFRQWNFSTGVGTSGNIVLLRDGGNVGIGTTSPSMKLHVEGGSTLISNSAEDQLILKSSNALLNPTLLWERQGEVNRSALLTNPTATTGGYYFRTGGSNGQSNTLMLVRNDGNVGIGTTIPGQKLDVVGNVAVTGTVDGVDISAIPLTTTIGYNYQSFTNILKNGNFESWSVGAYNVDPDGWTVYTGGIRSREGTIVKIGSYSLKHVHDSGYTEGVYQNVSPFAYYKGRTVTAGMWVKTTDTQVRIYIYDGISTYYSSYHSGSGEWEFLTATATIPLSAVVLSLRTEISGTPSKTAYFDGAILVEGSTVPAFSPKPLEDDGKTLTIDSINNRVGIGTTTPSEILEIGGTKQTIKNFGTDRTFATSTFAALDKPAFATYTEVSPTNKTFYGIGQVIGGLGFLANDTIYGNIQFFTGNLSSTGGAVAERMRITNTGNVGIGTTSPSGTLDVNGNTYLNNVYLQYPSTFYHRDGVDLAAGRDVYGNAGYTSQHYPYTNGNDPWVWYYENWVDPLVMIHPHTGGGTDGELYVNGYITTTGYIRDSPNFVSAGFIRISHGTYDLMGMNNAATSTRELISWGIAGTDTLRIAGDNDPVIIGGNAKFNNFVGVGVSPSAPLHVESSGSGLSTAQFLMWSTVAPNVQWLMRNNGSDLIIGSNEYSDMLHITRVGKVGIGTTSPEGKLQIGNSIFTGANGVFDGDRVLAMFGDNLPGRGGSALVYQSIYNDSTFPAYGLVFIDGPSTLNYNVWSISPDGPAKGDSLNFLYGAQATNIHTATPKVVFDGNGNVGIGTTTPSTTLELALNPSGGLALGQGKLYLSQGGDANHYIQYSASGIVYYDNTAHIFQGANVGIGITNPQYLLDINGNFRAGVFYDKDDISYYVDPNYYSFLSTLHVGGNVIPTNVLKVTGDMDVTGYVGIGTVVASGKLHIEGSTGPSRWMSLYNSAGRRGEFFINTLGSTGFPSYGAIHRYTNDGWTAIDSSNINNTSAYEILSRASTPNTATILKLTSEAGPIIFGTGGIDPAPAKMIITNDGNVGIGTTTPEAPLEIKTAGTNGAQLLIGMESPGFSTNNRFYFAMNNNFCWYADALHIGYAPYGTALPGCTSMPGHIMTIHKDGNIGVGTTSPGATLDIRSATASIIVGTAGGTGGVLYFGNASHGIKRAYSAANDVGVYTTSGDIYLSPSGTGTTYFVLKNSGNVGIGTATPTTKLDINTGSNVGTTNLLTLSGLDSLSVYSEYAQLTMGIANNTAGSEQGNLLIKTIQGGILKDILTYGAAATNALQLLTNGSPALTILSNGNIGIGNANPNVKLEATLSSGDITRFGTDALNYLYIANDGTTGFRIGTTDTTKTLAFQTNGGQTRLFIKDDGNVGIGTMSPGTKLDIVGDTAINDNKIWFRSAGDNNHYLVFENLGAGHDNNGLRLFEYGGFRFSTVSGDKVEILTNGNVGIGTTNPVGKLHVSGNPLSINAIFQTGEDRPSIGITGAYPQLVLMAEAPNFSHGSTIMLGSKNSIGNDHKHWSIGTSGQDSTFLDIGYHAGTNLNPHAGIRNYDGTTLFTILNSGNIGIGITAPTQRLQAADLAGTNCQIQSQSTVGLNTVQTYIQSDATGLQGLFGTLSNHPLRIRANNTDMISVLTSGNVGIGTTTPTAKLHVGGTPGVDGIKFPDGTLQTTAAVTGGWTSTTKTYADSPFTAAYDNTILCNATNGNMIINLPPAVSNLDKIYNIKKIDSSANTVTIDGNLSETIDGAATQVIPSQYDSLTIQSDGLNWYII